MTAPRRRALALCAVVLGAPLALADAGVLARAGGVVIERSWLEARAATLPEARWAELGTSWPERRRRLLSLLIDDALLTASAAPSARDAALAHALRAELHRAPPGAAQAVGDPSEPRARALELYRILVRTEAEARTLIAELSAASLLRFGQRAREVSIDSSTNMRGGYLGWVAAGGLTDVPELRVSPELYRAAERGADGELLREPVREAGGFGVVWRRASREERAPSAAESARQDAVRAAHQAQAAEERALLEALRREHLREHHPERLAGLEPAFPEPVRRRRPEPGPLRRPWLAPVSTERGLR